MGQGSTKLVHKTGSNYPASGLHSAVQSHNSSTKLMGDTDEIAVTVADMLTKRQEKGSPVDYFFSVAQLHTHRSPREFREKTI